MDTNRKFLLRPDKTDERDYAPLKLNSTMLRIPAKYDLRGDFTFPIFDQGRIGSCGANAGVAAQMFDNSSVELSRLFLYYVVRAMEGHEDEDYGVESLRDVCKAQKKIGVCSEKLWPYLDEKYLELPDSRAYDDSVNHRIKSYIRLSGLFATKLYISVYNKPVIFGMYCFESMMSQKVSIDGMLPIPSPNEEQLGGHAVLAVGYKKIKNSEYIIVRNSWGDKWGDKGYFYMPKDYFDKYTFDYWVLQ